MLLGCAPKVCGWCAQQYYLINFDQAGQYNDNVLIAIKYILLRNKQDSFRKILRNFQKNLNDDPPTIQEGV